MDVAGLCGAAHSLFEVTALVSENPLLIGTAGELASRTGCHVANVSA